MTALAAVLALSSAAAPPTSDKQINFNVDMVKTPPVLDGKVIAGEYNKAIENVVYGSTTVNFNDESKDAKLPADVIKDVVPDYMDVYLTYDASYLYAALVVKDDDYNQPYNDGNVWKGDYLEFCFGTNFGDTYDNMYDRLRILAGLKNTGESFATVSSAQAGTKIAKGTMAATSYAFSRDDKNNLTTYELKFAWADITADGKAPAKSYILFQSGVGTKKYQSYSQYDAYLGPFEWAGLLPADVQKSSGKRYVFHIANYTGKYQETPVAAPKKDGATTAAPKTFDATIAFAALASAAAAGVALSRKKKK